jgi:hypothetical protein
MDYLDTVLETMNQYTHLGTRILGNGTTLIGHVPHLAPEAWLHTIFTPLNSEELNQVASAVGGKIPSVFASFLLRCNGLRLFSCSVTIDGLRTSFARTGDAVWQPFSIRTPNVDERPRWAKPTFFFVGGYQWDGSLLYLDNSNQQVFRCRTKSSKVLTEWPSFEVMLETETQRLAQLFDQEGRQIRPEQPTTP